MAMALRDKQRVIYTSPLKVGVKRSEECRNSVTHKEMSHGKRPQDLWLPCK